MWYLGELRIKPTTLLGPGEGLPLFVITQDLDTDLYYDITSVTSLSDMGITMRDYCFIRARLIEMMGGSPNPFWNLSDSEKKIIATYCATDQVTLITYYMMQGMSQTEAITKYTNMRAADIRRAAGCYYERLMSPAFTATVMLYLGQDQGETFLDAIRNFSSDIKDIARLGTNYGNANDGLMDYIESTGSYTGGGLKNYNTNPGLALEDLIKTLKDIFYYGYTT